MNFIALDFETATAKRCSVCQVGMVRVRNSQIVAEFSSLVCPPCNEYSHWNQRVHGLGPEDTADAPSFEEVWPQMKAFIGEDMIVAHNVGFDRSCLRKCWEAFDITPLTNDYDCTYKLTGLSLDNCCAQYDIVLDNHHDALADAVACAWVYIKAHQASPALV